MRKKFSNPNHYQVCAHCVMDTTDSDIQFDSEGICNHCKQCVQLMKTCPTEVELNVLVSKIKERGKHQKYDCIIGLSGGVDSSYVAYQVKRLGLRPLAVHLDNGWDSELAVKNIENIARKLDFDLYTYVIDWEEFRDLQLAFLRASVVDIEMLTDHAITAVLFKNALQWGVKYIISGSNIATEAIMPRTWNHRKSDLRNIRAIQKLYGTKKIKSFPTASTYSILYCKYIRRIKMIRLLDFLPYDKQKAISILTDTLGWRHYGGKHYESIFTRFYQGYILPKKFGIDKRRAHLSALICSNQITRKAALSELQQESYDSHTFMEDKSFVLKKLSLSEEEFEQFMKAPMKSHLDYKSDQSAVALLLRARSIAQRAFRKHRSS